MYNPLPEAMERIAAELGMTPADYLVKTRKSDYVELRYITALLIRRYFDYITLRTISTAYGRTDHTLVMKGMDRVNDLIDARDAQLYPKYLKAHSVILLMLKQHRNADIALK